MKTKHLKIVSVLFVWTYLLKLGVLLSFERTHNVPLVDDDVIFQVLLLVPLMASLCCALVPIPGGSLFRWVLAITMLIPLCLMIMPMMLFVVPL